MHWAFRRSELRDIAEKVDAGERLSIEDGMRLYASHDVLLIGKLADEVNRRRNADIVYFVQNHRITPTNVCAFHCNFCSFRRNGNEPDAYIRTPQEIVDRASHTYTERTHEFHIVGGLVPDLGVDYYAEMLRELKKAFPAVHIKAFTAVEIDYMAKLSKLDWTETLTVLKDAGLDAMPGGGAEIFHPAVRRKICPEKVDGEGWLQINAIAHQLGIKTNATMLYGHIEQPEHRIDHLMKLREQQDRTGGFMTYIPLAYHPENNNLGRAKKLDWTTGTEDLKELAIGRLMLDNFAHIKGYWISITPRLAQVSLSYGVSDVDGTVVEEDIYHAAGARTEEGLTRNDLTHLIRAAGKIPVERDALYNHIEVYA
ncbi:MAG TPA: aminofutalosine synthase MqnE [Herpetosiphonaceae bacterium]|nr:aminofutalosine synthase MqnE [Herpetosiphonaceae bacterium]